MNATIYTHTNTNTHVSDIKALSTCLAPEWRVRDCLHARGTSGRRDTTKPMEHPDCPLGKGLGLLRITNS